MFGLRVSCATANDAHIAATATPATRRATNLPLVVMSSSPFVDLERGASESEHLHRPAAQDPLAGSFGPEIPDHEEGRLEAICHARGADSARSRYGYACRNYLAAVSHGGRIWQEA